MTDGHALDTPPASFEDLANAQQEAATLPRAFGPYVLLKLLSQGALGNVYLSITGPQVGVEKLCVIKRIRPELAAEERFIDVFRQQAQDLVHLNHGNIAQVFDIGRVGEENYLALEYVEGKDLRAILKRARTRQRPIPADVAVYLMTETLAGLDYAHRRMDSPGKPPLVHNDVCPENILVSFSGQVKIVDFGTAKATVLHRDTFQSLMPEKAYYMSPEQARSPSETDPRTDLFSAGVVLWEVVSGRRPHDIAPFDTHYRALMAGRSDLPPLGQNVTQASALDPIIRRATAADPAKRYRSAAEFKNELFALLQRINPRIGPDRVTGLLREIYGAEIEHERQEVQRLAGGDMRRVRDSASATIPHQTALFEQQEKTVIRRAVTRALGPQEQVAGVIPGTRYRIVRRIGEGAMGVVYAAEHVDLEKMVALKVLHEEFSTNAEFVARFRQEARAASKVGHPHIVDVTDFGETQDGRLFFAMEYLEGQSLAQAMAAAGPLGSERAVGIALQIGDALGSAHKKGIVHRDLKPENVFLLTRDGNDFVKILDFGIAKTEAPKKGGPRLTKAGSIFGTPHYMAPEQATGQPVDQRADIYSLGNLLYEMLTGVTPFVAPTAVEVLTLQIKERPLPPRERAPDLNIPATLDAIVMQALEKDPNERFQTMEEMSDALISAVTTLGPTPGDLPIAPIAATRAQSPDREDSGIQREIERVWGEAVAQPEASRRTIVVAMSIALGVGLLAGGIIVWGSKTGRLHGWIGGLQSMFGVGETAAIHTGPGVGGAPTPPPAEVGPGVTPVSTVPVATAPVVPDDDLGELVPASAIGRAAIARSEAAMKKAAHALRHHQAAAAEAAYHEALHANPRNADALAALADSAIDHGDAERAVRIATRGIEVAPQSSLMRTNLGRAYYRLGRYDDAIGEWRKVLLHSPHDHQVKRFIAQAQAAQRPGTKRR